MSDLCDPDYVRWRKKYPKYPGLKTCLDSLLNANGPGSKDEAIQYDILENSNSNIDELVEYAQDPKYFKIRLIILGILSEMNSEELIVFWKKVLSLNNEDECKYAIWGLQKIDTKESRRVLWEFKKN